MRKLCKKILTLEFEDDPPYEDFIRLIESEMEEDHEFEWTHNHASKIKAQIMKENRGMQDLYSNSSSVRYFG